MSDAPITPRSNAAVPDTTVPMATKPVHGAGAGASPTTAPMNARATQMSASVGPGTLESPPESHAQSPPEAPPRIDLPPHDLERPFVSEEISGVLVTQEASREASPQAAPRRIGASTLESRLVPSPANGADGASAPLPPLPPVIDVGAPAHAFVAKSPAAPPPMPSLGPGAHPRTPPPAHRGGHAHAAPVAPARSTSTSTMALVVVGVVIGLVGIAAVVVALGFVAARRTAANRPGRPSVGATSPGETAAGAPSAASRAPGAAATQAPRPVRK